MTIVIYSRVRQLRVGKSMTQSDLAQSVGVSRQSIISLESGRCNPSLPLAFQLAEIFEMAVEDIFCPGKSELKRKKSQSKTIKIKVRNEIG